VAKGLVTTQADADIKALDQEQVAEATLLWESNAVTLDGL